jgi:hypothetical protein
MMGAMPPAEGDAGTPPAEGEMPAGDEMATALAAYKPEDIVQYLIEQGTLAPDTQIMEPAMEDAGEDMPEGESASPDLSFGNMGE